MNNVKFIITKHNAHIARKNKARRTGQGHSCQLQLFEKRNMPTSETMHD